MTYIAQLFDKHVTRCLHIAKHDASLLSKLFQSGGNSEFYRSGRFQFELVRPNYVWDTGKYTRTYVEFSAQLTFTGIDSLHVALNLM